VLAIGAGADQMWPSFIGAERIRERLIEHGRPQAAEVHVYPGAGHMITRVGYGGRCRHSCFIRWPRTFEATGGLPNANCEGSYDAWDHVLGFLSRINVDVTDGGKPRELNRETRNPLAMDKSASNRQIRVYDPCCNAVAAGADRHEQGCFSGEGRNAVFNLFRFSGTIPAR